MTALRTAGLTRHFGAVAAVSDVSLELAAGARHALIGPNGAGKTTLVNLLSGALAPTSGEIFVGGDCVTTLSQHARVRRGLARTFQVNSLFPQLTVRESVLLAALQREGRGAQWWRAARGRAVEASAVDALLAALGLGDDADRATALLPYGRRRLLEIALALASRPRILILDEPAAGIAREDSERLLEAVSRLPAETAVLLIEHDMDLVFRFAQQITVLVGGRILAQGTPAAIASNADVRAAYLGASDHA